MRLSIDKNQFLSNILGPVSKISDNLLLSFEQDKQSNQIVKSIVSSVDNSVVLLSRLPCKTDITTQVVIPDCKTFLRLFAGIEQDNVSLEINSNSISYSNSSFSFKYHLLDESYIINKKNLSEDKINSLTFDTSFIVTKQKISELLKFNSIVPDAEKLYFFSKQKKIYAKLGDDQKNNTNEIEMEITSLVKGNEITENFPINIQNVMLFSFPEDEITISVNHKLKIFKFETSCLKYIVSGLVK